MTELQDAQKYWADYIQSRPHDSETLLVFLRHHGCTFCREWLEELTAAQSRGTFAKTSVVVVHMSNLKDGEAFLKKSGVIYDLQISDPDLNLYRQFHLKRGSFNQLFGWRSFFYGFLAGILKRLGVGALQGDGFQMPGVFLFKGKECVNRWVPTYASELPCFEEIMKKKNKTPRLSVFYDGACPLCAREIDHYRKKDKAGAIEYVDISLVGFDAKKWNLDFNKVRKHLHVLDHQSGKIYTGVDSFIAIWKVIPGFYGFAKTAELKWVKPILKVGYAVFAEIRPYLPGKKPCPPEGCPIHDHK